MDKPIELTPLVCLRCSTPIPAALDEVAWVCENCHQGLSLDEETGLTLLEVNFSTAIPSSSTGRPYWVADGQASMDRKTFGSSRKQANAAEQFWGQPRRFFVPAYQASLEKLLARSRQLLLNPPILQGGAPVQFKAVIRPSEDVLSAAEFIILAIEAERKDKIKSINFDLHLSTPVLWILPD